jgi:hypothetical protein
MKLNCHFSQPILTLKALRARVALLAFMAIAVRFVWGTEARLTAGRTTT